MSLFVLFVCLFYNEVPKPEHFTNERVSFNSQFLSFGRSGCNIVLALVRISWPMASQPKVCMRGSDHGSQRGGGQGIGVGLRGSPRPNSSQSFHMGETQEFLENNLNHHKVVSPVTYGHATSPHHLLTLSLRGPHLSTGAHGIS